MTVDLAVIGGGMAGLVTARTAARAGASVVLLEAASTVGGLVGAQRVAGLDLDSGAESFATRGGHVATLAGDLGIETAVLDPIEGLTDETTGEDYLSLMEQNLEAIRTANSCS